MRGSVRKDGATWCVVFDVGADPMTGKRQQRRKRGFKTKRDAEKYLAEQLHSLETGMYVKPSSMTLGQYLDYWLDNYARLNLTPKTYECYVSMVRAHIKPALGGVELSKLQPVHLQQYYVGKQDDGLSAQTVRHHHRLICKALNDAAKWQLIGRNVSLAVTPPKPRKVDIITLDVEAVNQLLDAATGSQYRPVIFTAVQTGMRRGEILGLRWQDVDLKNMTIHVTQSLQVATGHGSFFKAPKNGKGRSLVMTEVLVDLLKRHKVAQAEIRLMLGDQYQDQGLVFAQANGKPLQPTELTRAFNKFVKQAGIPKVRFHDLRHTHATLMLKQGVHPKVVSERLGHSTIGITLDIYSHVMPNMQRQAVQDFERLFAETGSSNP